MCISRFGKIYVIIVCHEDIHGRYYIQKSDNDHFHPYFDIIVFKMKRSSFPIVQDKQTQLWFLPCLAPTGSGRAGGVRSRDYQIFWDG